MALCPDGNPPHMDAIRAVSWDVDGTLYSIRRALGHALIQATRSAVRGDGWRPFRELAELREIWRCRESAGYDSDGIARVRAGAPRRLELERRWWAPALARSGLRPGVRALLDEFRHRGYIQVVLSDYAADDKLRHLGLEDCFDAVYAGERLGCFKSGPAPFERVLSDFALTPARLLHIGDRPDADGAGADAAGCPVLLLGRDFADFRELHAMLTGGVDRDLRSLQED